MWIVTFPLFPGDILEDIVRNKNHFDLATTITLAHILKYAVRVLLEAVPVDDQVQNSLVLEVSNTLNVWLESSTSHDLQIACLGDTCGLLTPTILPTYLLSVLFIAILTTQFILRK